MRTAKVELYLHAVWSTSRRAALLTSVLEPQVHRCFCREAERLGCVVFAVNGAEDHVHILVRMPAKLSVSSLMKQLKGVSSRFVNDTFRGEDHFRWQERYGAFSISRSHLPRVIRYVENQKQHHAAGTVWPQWEETNMEEEDRALADTDHTE